MRYVHFMINKIIIILTNEYTKFASYEIFIDGTFESFDLQNCNH